MQQQEQQASFIEVPDAPPLPGLAFRRYRGGEDPQGMADVFNASREEDGWGFYLTSEGIRNEMENLANADPRLDVLMAELDGRVVGYGTLEWLRELSGELRIALRVRLVPSLRGRGIRRAMLRHQEAWGRERAISRWRDKECRFSYFICEGEASMQALLEEEGYSPVRYYFEMLRPLDEPIPDLPLPPGLRVRPPATEEEYRRVFDAEVEASADEWGALVASDLGFGKVRGDPNFDPEMWVVAWDGDRVAGAVRNWVDEQENRVSGRLWGYTEDIFVARPYRRQGLARALIARSLRLVADRGMEHANLGVDSENATGALDLYTGMGYRQYRRYIVLSKPLG